MKLHARLRHWSEQFFQGFQLLCVRLGYVDCIQVSFKNVIQNNSVGIFDNERFELTT